MIRKVDFDKAISVYNGKIINDFPEEEIPPLVVFEKCIKQGIFECFRFENDNEELGYIVTRKVDDLVFIMVFAVDKNQRGKGYGKSFLNEFKEILKENKIILLEAENPEVDGLSEEEKISRRKRIKFYEDLDFKVTENLKYILVGVDYKILYYNLENDDILEPEEIKNYMEKIYNNVLRDKSFLKMEITK